MQIISILTFITLVWGCNPEDKKKGESRKELSAEVASERNDLSESSAEADRLKQNKPSHGETLIDIDTLQEGEWIEGLKVSDFQYYKNEFFRIDLKGEKQLGGYVIYNKFEDSWDVQIDETFLPATHLLVGGEVYPLFTVLSVRNRGAFLRALGGESVSMIRHGESVHVTCRYDNFTVGHHLDKGRRGVALVDYITAK